MQWQGELVQQRYRQHPRAVRSRKTPSPLCGCETLPGLRQSLAACFEKHFSISLRAGCQPDLFIRRLHAFPGNWQIPHEPKDGYCAYFPPPPNERVKFKNTGIPAPSEPSHRNGLTAFNSSQGIFLRCSTWAPSQELALAW